MPEARRGICGSKLCLPPAIGDRRGGAYAGRGRLDRASSPGRAAQQPLGGGIAAEEDRGQPIEIGVKPDVDVEGMTVENRRVVALEPDQQAAIAAGRTIERERQPAIVKIGERLARQRERLARLALR